jgi:NADH:ubiquinone reductase (non-electrogenic)
VASVRAIEGGDSRGLVRFHPSSFKKMSRLPKVLIAGTGWAATSVLKRLTKTSGTREAFDITVVSPRNHMLFTPLLASSAVGTLGFNSIAESTKYDFPSVSYLPANVTAIDVANRKIRAAGPLEPTKLAPSPTAGVLSVWEGEKIVERDYDVLILAIGARNNTFGVPGVEENAFYLKELEHARAIRSRIIQLVEAASRPDTQAEERRRLLSFVICGGGPTGVEFSAELHDFLTHDILALYPELSPFIKITIIDGRGVLGAFDASLREYTARKFARDRIEIRTGSNVVKVEKHAVHLSDGTIIPSGLAVWNTGLGPRPLIASLDGNLFRKTKWGHLVTDESLRCLHASSASSIEGQQNQQPLSFIPGIFGLGDCASVLTRDYAATAQVAEQQGKYLGELLLDAYSVVPLQLPESGAKESGDKPPVIATVPMGPASAGSSAATGVLASYTPKLPFIYRHGGSLAFIGSYKAVSDFSKAEKQIPLHGHKLKGWISFVIWRSAYLTTLGSWRNRMRVPMDWLKTMLFGRDTLL